MDAAKSINHYARELGIAPPHQHASRRRDVADDYSHVVVKKDDKRAPPVESVVEGEWLGRRGAEYATAQAGFQFQSQAQRESPSSRPNAGTYAAAAYQETSTLSLTSGRDKLVDFYA